MNRRSFFSLFSATDAEERRARSWLALIGLLAAIALVAIASSPAHSEIETSLIMRNHIDNWLVGDWVVFNTHVRHWPIALAGIASVALLVAWFERPKHARGTDFGKAA